MFAGADFGDLGNWFGSRIIVGGIGCMIVGGGGHVGVTYGMFWVRCGGIGFRYEYGKAEIPR